MNKQSLHIPIEVSNLLKLIACIVILLHHYAQFGLDSHKLDGLFFEVLRSVGGDLSVTIFFFLSGYGLIMSEKSREFQFRRFAIKRFWRVLKPFLLVNFAAVVAYWILGVDNVATQSTVYAIGSILGLIRFDQTMWFIHYLLGLYILFGIGMLLRRPILFVSISVCLYIIIALITNQPSHLWSSLFAFPLGMIVGQRPDRLLRFFRRYDVIIASLVLYAIVMYEFVFVGPKINGLLWHQMNNILLIIILLFVIGRIPMKYVAWYKLPSKWQPYYEVYLVHPKILFITIFSFGCFLPLWLFLPLTVGIALIFCNLPSMPKFNRLFNKIC